MEIIIRIQNINDWNIAPLFSEVSIGHLSIENWVYLRIFDFKKEKLVKKCKSSLVYSSKNLTEMIIIC
jgi:hypothetical protein